jgi:hypothetical protein
LQVSLRSSHLVLRGELRAKLEAGVTYSWSDFVDLFTCVEQEYKEMQAREEAKEDGSASDNDEAAPPAPLPTETGAAAAMATSNQRISNMEQQIQMLAANVHRGGGQRFIPACRDFAGGNCKRGKGCRYSHAVGFNGRKNSQEKSWQASARASGRGSKGGICHNFRDTGMCRFGDACIFSHTKQK